MAKRKLYRYNPETDNFERFYPSFKDRLGTIITIVLIGLILAVGFYLVIFYMFETPTVENLTAENNELKQKLKNQVKTFDVLDDRVNYTMDVMRAIQERDSNVYRVLMQMDSIGPYIIYPEDLTSEKSNKLSKINDSNLVSSLTARLDSIDRAILLQSYSFNDLIRTAKENKEKMRHIPSVIPLHIKDYTMSSGFGMRIDPVYEVPRFHAGLDFAAGIGTPVYATADGKVEQAGDRGTYGNCIDINHGNNYLTRYGHLSKINVKSGQTVKRGDLIGFVGSTGKSTGPHLHYEVRFKAEPQNPVNYYFMDITPAEYDKMIQQAANAGHVMD